MIFASILTSSNVPVGGSCNEKVLNPMRQEQQVIVEILSRQNEAPTQELTSPAPSNHNLFISQAEGLLG